MADTTAVTFTRPVRVNKKRYVKGADATISADIAAELIECGAAIEAKPAKEPEPAKK